MKVKSKGVAFLLGAIAGSVVGSVTALLFAPKSGKELRKDIKVGAEKAYEASSAALDKVAETVYDVSQKVEEKAVQAVNNVKQGFEQVVSNVKQFGKEDEQSEKVSDTAILEAAESSISTEEGQEVKQEAH